MSGGNLDFPNGDTAPKQNIRSVVDVINFVNSGNTMNVVFQNTDKYILNWSVLYKNNEHSWNRYIT